mmetsp:Transcript_7026/g.14089  ORF Transcript_7026/g.14089 Transcript_7026/m.14089 type:complete len:566 (-) Transcript_7026:244-1941(-)
MDNWDCELEGERLYEGNFYPPNLVLDASEIELLSAVDDGIDSSNGEKQNSDDKDQKVTSVDQHHSEDEEDLVKRIEMPRGQGRQPQNCREEVEDLGDVENSFDAIKDSFDQNDDEDFPFVSASAQMRRSRKAKPEESLAPTAKCSRTRASREETEEEKDRRREIVAAASRATRQKRKREREELKIRNDQLEKDRDVYMMRIAELQTEVQALRNSGSINLSKENDLLRIEIRKHKAFIRNIVEATQAVPRLTSEERYRLARNGCNSGVAQVVGLAYTSAVDSSWHWSPYDAIDYCGRRSPAYFGVQLLPRGCDLTSAKRSNIRLDLPWRSESIEELRKKIWKVWTAPEVYTRVYSGPWANNAIVSIEEIPSCFEGLQEPDDAEMRIYHYVEEFGRNKETDEERSAQDCTLCVAWKYTKLITRSSYPESPRERTEKGVSEAQLQEHSAALEYAALHPPAEAFQTTNKDDPEACVIITSTTVDSNLLKPKVEGVHRLNAPSVESVIIRRGPESSGSLLTLLMSWPLTEDGYSGFTTDNGLVTNDFACGPNGDLIFSTFINILNNLDVE